MNHTALIEEARALAETLQGLTGIPFPGGRPGGTVKHTPPTDDECWRGTDMLHGLAKIIEEQDVRITRMSEAADKPDPVRTEAVAACKTCDEAIGAMITPASAHAYPPAHVETKWINLRTARYLAQCAVKLAKAKVEHVEETSKLAHGELHDLLNGAAAGRQASEEEEAAIIDTACGKDSVHNRGGGPCEPPGYSEFRDRAKALMEATSKLSEKDARAAIDQLLNEAVAEMVAECNRHVDSISQLRTASQAVVRAVQGKPSDPPIEVEMRVGGHVGGGWTWECCWSGIWFAPLHDDLQHAFTQKSCARGAATRWLAAFGDQLGRKLVGKWEEGA